MTKDELATKVAAKTGIDKKDVVAAIGATIRVISESLCIGETVHFRGFGAFEVRHRKAKKARVVTTGEELTVAPKYAPVFKPATELKKSVAKRLPVQ